MTFRFRERAVSLLGVGLLSLSAATLATVGAPPATAAETGSAETGSAESGSAVTVSGTGPFADLKVTVSQTASLVNEVVQVSWTGGTPTRGNFGTDYLQIMQCWGDASSGPEREQCQFGGLTGDLRGGGQVASRQLTYDFIDPAESYRRGPTGKLRFAPFRSVTGKTVEAAQSEFFDASTTNEAPFSATRPDGKGVLPFEVQTALEAPGLGCGTSRAATGPSVPVAAPPVATGTATTGLPAASGLVNNPGRRCWLVVVPRDHLEVDGSKRLADTARPLQSSPLSQSNWNHRLVVPLDFLELGKPCPLGKSERAIVGQENVGEAVSSWSPALCADDGPVFSFSQLPDAVARRQLVSDAPGLALTTRPVPPASLPPGRALSYAPVALSGLTIAFNIESQSAFNAPAQVKTRNGQRIQELNLTPRLVAKLLTQTYRSAAAPGRPGLEKNPLDLTRDPDFLASNPAFAQLNFVSIPSIVVPAGLSDAGGLLWKWVLADAEAKAFVQGVPDPSGTVVNPAYKGLGQQDGFPKSDTVCTTFAGTTQPPLCTLDSFPYAGDFREAARGAARGDRLSRGSYDSTTVPPSYRRSPPQPLGSRSVLALADTATAERFGLQTASLRNSSGAFVAPTESSLLVGLGAMKPGAVASVLEPDLTSKQAGVYPLSLLTYAATVESVLTPSERKEYAAFLRYAVGSGQRLGSTPGLLPLGYAPLPEALREGTLAFAAKVALIPKTNPGGSAPTAPQPTTPVATDPATVGGPNLLLGPGAGAIDALGFPDSVLASGPASNGGSPVLAPGTGAGQPVDVAPLRPSLARALLVAAPTPTPSDVIGAGRYAVVVVLTLGGFAALGGAFLRRPTRRTLASAAA